MEYLSKQRFDEISAELKHLINEVYPKVQDAGEPPTNMRKTVSSFEAPPMPLTDTVLNPAVLAVAEANRDSISRSPTVCPCPVQPGH